MVGEYDLPVLLFLALVTALTVQFAAEQTRADLLLVGNPQLAARAPKAICLTTIAPIIASLLPSDSFSLLIVILTILPFLCSLTLALISKEEITPNGYFALELSCIAVSTSSDLPSLVILSTIYAIIYFAIRCMHKCARHYPSRPLLPLLPLLFVWAVHFIPACGLACAISKSLATVTILLAIQLYSSFKCKEST